MTRSLNGWGQVIQMNHEMLVGDPWATIAPGAMREFLIKYMIKQGY
jgi:hypothetical protein